MIRFFTEKPAKNVVENDDEVTEVGGEDGNKENGVRINHLIIYTRFCI